MSIASCIIDLNNSAWIMISVAMICFTIIIYIGCLFGLKFEKHKKSHKQSCNRTTTIKYKDDEVVIKDEETPAVDAESVQEEKPKKSLKDLFKKKEK